MNISISRRIIVTMVGSALTLMATSSANATTTPTQPQPSARAYAIDADLPLGISVGPVPLSSVTGVNKSASASLATLNISPYLTTGLLNSHASTSSDGRSAFASSSIVDFELNIPGLSLNPWLPSTPALGLSFDALSSSSKVTRSSTGYSSVGNSSIFNLQGSGLLAGLGLVVLDGSANQKLLSAPGISVIANRQSTNCPSINSCYQTTDALYVYIDKVAELTLASSTAAIPEPSTYAMMLAGLLGIGAVRKLKNRPDA